MSQVSLGRPEFVPGTPPGHPTAKFLYVIFLYWFFSLLRKGRRRTSKKFCVSMFQRTARRGFPDSFNLSLFLPKLGGFLNGNPESNLTSTHFKVVWFRTGETIMSTQKRTGVDFVFNQETTSCTLWVWRSAAPHLHQVSLSSRQQSWSLHLPVVLFRPGHLVRSCGCMTICMHVSSASAKNVCPVTGQIRKISQHPSTLIGIKHLPATERRVHLRWPNANLSKFVGHLFKRLVRDARMSWKRKKKRTLRNVSKRNFCKINLCNMQTSPQMCFKTDTYCNPKSATLVTPPHRNTVLSCRKIGIATSICPSLYQQILGLQKTWHHNFYLLTCL